MEPARKIARLAGLLYLILGVAGFYSLMYVSPKIIVRGDAMTTARNILANEFLFRTGVVSNLFSAVVFIFLALVFYRLFKAVNPHQAKALVALVIVQVPIIFLLETCKLISLLILKGDVVKVAEPDQLPNLAFLFLKIHGYGILVVELFWGLWLIPLGQLVYRSGFIPRLLGVLLLLAGMGYTVDSLTFMLFPEYRSFTRLPAYGLSGLGELSIILWLLIKGINVQKIGIDSTSSKPLPDRAL